MVKKAQWWFDPTTADQCGQNPANVHANVLYLTACESICIFLCSSVWVYEIVQV